MKNQTKYYFEGLKSESEIKLRYKDLAKQNHPDLGGCQDIMKAINAQYEQVLKGQYQKEGKSLTEIEELLKNDLILRKKLYEILAIESLTIEICGSWLWVTGKTQENRKLLKEAKFYWANKKKAWYWRSDENKSFNRKAYSLAEIRLIHGSEKLKTKKQAQIA